MILERERNEPCICGSGKKFKKCCNDKQYDDFKDIELCVGRIDIEEFKDSRDRPTDDDIDLLEQLFRAILLVESFDAEQKQKIVGTLSRLKYKYPNLPTVASHFYNFYMLQEQYALAQPYLDEMKTRFPTYVHGAASAAKEALDRKDFDSAFAYFRNSNSLKEFDPRRTVFSLGEAIVFHTVLIEYYIKKEDGANIVRHYKNLVMPISMNDGSSSISSYYVEIARKMIKLWDLQRALKTVAAYYESINDVQESIEGIL